MNQECEATPKVKVMGPEEDKVFISAAPNPFTTETIQLYMPEGHTLADALMFAQPEKALRMGAHIFIDDMYIPPENWYKVRPKAGTTVNVRVVPQGGGGGGGSNKSTLRIILTIAVIGAAIAVPAAFPALSATSIFGSLTVGKLIGASILFGGMILIDALTKPPKPKLPSLSNGRGPSENDSPTLFVTGTRNEFTPFGVVPRPLGKHRMTPPYGAQPYSETVGDDQFLRTLFVWGYGPLQLSDLRIDQTLLSNFSEVEVEHTGVQGKSYSLEPNLELESTNTLDFTKDFSIFFRLKLDNTPDSAGTILMHCGGKTGGFTLYINGAGKLVIRSQQLHIGSIYAVGTEVLAADTTYDLLMTWDKSTTQFKMYVDGIEDIDTNGTIPTNAGAQKVSINGSPFDADWSFAENVTPKLSGLPTHVMRTFGQDKILRPAPHNYASYSEAAGSWTTASITVVDDELKDMDDELIADKITFNAVQENARITETVTARTYAGEYVTWKFQGKSGEEDGKDQVISVGIWSNDGGYDTDDLTLTSTWQEFTVTKQFPVGSTSRLLALTNGPTSGHVAYVSKLQVNSGKTALPYVKTAGAPKYTVPAEYDHESGALLGVPLFSTYTNQFLWTENLAHASWSKTAGVSILDSDIVGPDGEPTAYRIAFDTSGGTQSLSQATVPVTGGLTYVMQVALQQTGTNNLLRMRSRFIGNVSGTISGGAALSSRTAVELPDTSWRIFSVSFTAGASDTTVDCRFEIQSGDTTADLGHIHMAKPMVSTGKSVCQRPYVPSDGTRRSWTAFDLAGDISNVDQPNGSIYVEFNVPDVVADSHEIFGMSDGSTANMHRMYIGSSKQLQNDITASSTTTYAVDTTVAGAIDDHETVRFAYFWNTNNANAAYSPRPAVTWPDATVTVPTGMTEVHFGGPDENTGALRLEGYLKRVVFSDALWLSSTLEEFTVNGLPAPITQAEIDDFRIWGEIALQSGDAADLTKNRLHPVDVEQVVGWLDFDNDDFRDYTRNNNTFILKDNAGTTITALLKSDKFNDPGLSFTAHPLSLYSNDVDEQPLSILIDKESGWITQTSREETDELSVDITFLQGLTFFSGGGTKTERNVKLEVQYSIAGADNWSYVNTTDASGVQLPEFDITGKQTNALRRNINWKVPRNRYDVRIRRLTDDTDDAQTIDKATWTALRSITVIYPIDFAGVTATAIRIRGTEQLNGVLNELNGIVESLHPDYDIATDTWIFRTTSNPASLYREVTQGTANERPMPDSRVDIPNLEDWHEFCRINNFEFNMIRDFRSTVFETMIDIATVGRASPARTDGTKWGVVIDREQTIPVQMFTPRNSSGFRGEKSFPDLPHALRARFVNREKDWQQDERIVFREGFVLRNPGPGEQKATKYEAFDLPGITDPEHIFKDTRFHVAQALLRPERYTLNVLTDYLVAQRGSLVHVSHDVPKIGLGSGRVKQVIDDGTNVTGIILDTYVEMVAGNSYAIRIRPPDAPQMYEGVVTIPTSSGLTNTLILTTPILIADGPAVGDLVTYGIAGRVSADMLVLAVMPRDELNAKLLLADYDVNIYKADSETIPPFNSNLSSRAGTDYPAAVQLRSDENVLIQQTDGSWAPQIRITLAFSASRPSSGLFIQARHKIAGTSGEYSYEQFPIGSSEIGLLQVDIGETYDINLRFLLAGDTVGVWGPTLTHTVIGTSTLPPDVPSAFKEGAFITWEYDDPDNGIPPVDHKGFIVKSHAGTNRNWTSATKAHDGVITTNQFPIAQLPKGVRTVMIKAVDAAGNESSGAATVVLNLGDELISNILYELDRSEQGYPGTITDGAVNGIDLEADSDGSLFLPTAEDLFLGGITFDTELFLPVTYLTMTYLTQAIALHDLLPYDIVVDPTISGSWTLSYRTGDSEPFLPVDDQPFLGDQGNNLFTYSRQMDNGAWTKTGLTITADAADGYDGTTVADKLVETATTGTHVLQRVLTTKANNHYMFDFYFRADERTQVRLEFGGASAWGGTFAIVVDVAAQEVLQKTVDYGGFEEVVGQPGLYHIWGRQFATTAASAIFRAYLLKGGSTSYSGTLTEGAYIDGMNLAIVGADVTTPIRAIDTTTAAAIYGAGLFMPFSWSSDTYKTWPGRVTADSNIDVYEFKLVVQGAAAQGVVSDFSIVFDIEDAIQIFDDFKVYAGGTRLPVDLDLFREIKVVNVTLQDDGGDAVNAKVLDKDRNLANGGPLIGAFNSVIISTDGLVDVTIQGAKK